jgi:hypothetical protein
LLGTLALLLVGCSSGQSVPKPKTALELREIQTRSFETTDTKMVMKSLIATLQDEGFIVKNANVDLGLITAEKEVDITGASTTTDITPLVVGLVELAVRIAAPGNSSSGGSSMPSSDDSRWAKYRVIDCSANVSEFGAQTRVRTNFQVKTIDNKGDVMGIEQVEDGVFYQDFFSKVDKGLFITKEKL